MSSNLKVNNLCLPRITYVYPEFAVLHRINSDILLNNVLQDMGSDVRYNWDTSVAGKQVYSKICNWLYCYKRAVLCFESLMVLLASYFLKFWKDIVEVFLCVCVKKGLYVVHLKASVLENLFWRHPFMVICNFR